LSCRIIDFIKWLFWFAVSFLLDHGNRPYLNPPPTPPTSDLWRGGERPGCPGQVHWSTFPNRATTVAQGQGHVLYPVHMSVGARNQCPCNRPVRWAKITKTAKTVLEARATTKRKGKPFPAVSVSADPGCRPPGADPLGADPRAPTPGHRPTGRRPPGTDRPPTVAQLPKPKPTTFQHTCAHAVLLAQLPASRFPPPPRAPTPGCRLPGTDSRAPTAPLPPQT